MRKSLVSEIELYKEMTEHLSKYRDSEEVIALFVNRELIHDRLLRGEKVSSEVLGLLEEGDKTLASLWRKLFLTFPTVFEPGRKANIPRAYWWWHLDEGPQVREEAEKAKVA